LQLQGDLNDIDMAFFKNQAKPQVDLIAGFQAQGLAGELSRRSSPIPGAPPPSADNPFGGGLETSLSNLKDFRSYRIGVSISLPLRNRTAEANIGRTQAVSRQLDQQKRMMVQGIVADVRNATQAVETARKRVEAAHASVMAAEEQLKGEEQKFAAGLSTNFFVLQRQNELSIARGNELRAKTDYNKARADLQRVMANNIP
jgi:HAE1 family hydrophobic/amphiphilic exporter-1